MKVAKLYLQGSFKSTTDLATYPDFVKNCIINSTADLEMHNKEIKYIGSATECALLLLCKGYDYTHMRQESHIIKQIPFNSQNKYMMTILKQENNYEIFSKGAPEVVIKQCGFEKIGEQVINADQENESKLF